jgi:hypothetical protein
MPDRLSLPDMASAGEEGGDDGRLVVSLVLVATGCDTLVVVEVGSTRCQPVQKTGEYHVARGGGLVGCGRSRRSTDSFHDWAVAAILARYARMAIECGLLQYKEMAVNSILQSQLPFDTRTHRGIVRVVRNGQNEVNSKV